jgi:hypothetical protein
VLTAQGYYSALFKEMQFFARFVVSEEDEELVASSRD